MLTYHDYSEIANEGLLAFQYPEKPESLYAPIKYAISCGGKRLRPVLTLAACHALGHRPEEALPQAVAVEMFHNFTLLHDDVMDHADMRRGNPTVHKKYGENTAILSGDAMLTLATMHAGDGFEGYRHQQLCELFNRTALEVYAGQQYDMEFEQRLDVTIDEYMEMIRLKTSVLLGCACCMGAIAADSDKEMQNAFYRYGERLGLAFQLRDDLLDTYGDPKTFGKEIGGDIMNDKKTWLLITAMAEDATGVIAEQISNPSPREEKITAVREAYNLLNLRSRCENLIKHYSDMAIDALKPLELNHESLEFFTNLALKASNRNN